MKIEIKRANYGKFQALTDVKFELKRGKILALIGQNGAGKSTTINALLGLLTQVDGQIDLVERVKGDDTFLNRVGYVPEVKSVDERRTIWDQVKFQAQLKGMTVKEIKAALPPLLEKFQVVGNEKTPIKKLSKGNQQKIQIIVGVIHQPDYLILDEPFSGLDPINAQILYEFIEELAAKGVTFLISSHNMQALEKIADDVLILKAGRQIFYGSREDLRGASPYKRITVRSSRDLSEQFVGLPVTPHFDNKQGLFSLSYQDDSHTEELTKRLKALSPDGDYFDARGLDLEEIFKELA